MTKANEILKAVIGEGEAVHKEPRHEVKDAYPTWQKSMDLIDFEFKTDLPEGLKKMWEWAKKQPNRERFMWPKYELNKGIYGYWKTK